jgi:hypothetical protein
MLCYDMIAKSQTEEGHLADRGKSFDRVETTQTEVESESVHLWSAVG